MTSRKRWEALVLESKLMRKKKDLLKIRPKALSYTKHNLDVLGFFKEKLSILSMYRNINELLSYN